LKNLPTILKENPDQSHIPSNKKAPTLIPNFESGMLMMIKAREKK
jgi:hypothetical protein